VCFLVARSSMSITSNTRVVRSSGQTCTDESSLR
jgi:hypothetical protein